MSQVTNRMLRAVAAHDADHFGYEERRPAAIARAKRAVRRAEERTWRRNAADEIAWAREDSTVAS